MYHQSNIEALSLLFGSACNLKCGYCLQQDDSPKNNRKADLDEFIDKFIFYTKINKLQPQTVHYWGGEPLLYWQRVKKIYTNIAPLFNAKMHRITTNGTLIHQDYIDFCNAHDDIFTVVSYHDGDIPEDKWRLIGKLKHFSIESLIHHKRTSPLLLRDAYLRISEIFGFYPTMGFDMIKANDGCGSDYWLTESDLDEYFEAIETCKIMADYGKDKFAEQVIAHFLFRYLKDKRYRSVAPNPCCNSRILSIDLFGNTYNCHHDNSPTNVTGNIFSNFIPIHPVPKIPLTRFSQSDDCKKCEVFNSCGGGCFTSNTHEVECIYYKRRAKLAEKYLRENAIYD